MPPKGKKAATAKPPKAEKESKPEKKGKASKKGSGEGNDTAPKVASRASKRNADKVAVSYKEVAENVDEKASEGSRPRVKPSKAKKTKVDSGSDVSESDEEADSEAEKPKKKRSPAKKRPVKEKVTAPQVAKEPATAEADDDDDVASEEDEPLPTKKAKVEEAAEAEPKEKQLKGKTDTDFDSMDFKSDKTTSDGKLWNKKISSWNVGGLKAWVKKGALEYLKHENPDVFCMQETRCQESKLPPGTKVEGYHAYWHCGASGHDGVAIYTKEMPIEVKYGMDKSEHDVDCRIITAEFEKFYLVNAYVPNSGRGLVTLPKRLKWDPDFRTFLKDLDNKKAVILCGDLNVAHQAIDLTNPKTNAKTAGYTQEERDGMSELLKEGFVDTYRELYPDKTGEYTFWTYMNNARAKNIGWRVDYFLVSEKLKDNVCDSLIRTQVFGSDHCPITLLVNV